MDFDTDPTPVHDRPASSRRPWVVPTLSELPRLNDLTLQTGGIPGGGGSVVP